MRSKVDRIIKDFSRVKLIILIRSLLQCLISFAKAWELVFLFLFYS